MIEVKNLSKVYGEYRAVHNISFSAHKGEVVGFLGPNGAGKTTTMRMLVTYLPPSSGTASIEGFDISSEGEEVRKRVGYLPETPPLYGEMTVAEYLSFVAQIKKLPGRSIKEAVEKSMERCFLTDVRRKLCQQLSKGYRQRVGLAQAIIHEPAVIILDEPTSGLDPRQIIEIRELMIELAKERTVLLSTHILPEVLMVCTKVVIVNQGRTVAEDSLANLTRERSLEEVFLSHVSADLQTVQAAAA